MLSIEKKKIGIVIVLIVLIVTIAVVIIPRGSGVFRNGGITKNDGVLILEWERVS